MELIKNSLIIIFSIFISIQLVFASPNIEIFNVGEIFPGMLQISWKVTSTETELQSIQIFKDIIQIYQENIMGSSHSGVYQVKDDNKTHTFNFIVYDELNLTVKKSETTSPDVIAPKITSSSKIISNKKELVFETNEPAICAVGFSDDNLNIIKKEYEIKHSITMGFKEGLNKAYVKCVDKGENEMSNSIALNFILDTEKPGKVGLIDFSKSDSETKITWVAAEDTNGIDSYNIYDSIEKVASVKINDWVTTKNTSTYWISAVDKAGNEGDKVEYSLGRAVLIKSVFEPKKEIEKETEKKDSVKKENLNISTISIIAFSVFGTLAIVFILWKIYEHKTDRHGLRKYLRHRRKMRDIDVSSIKK